jgi:uncharacterized protein YcbK (DUF882 family)
LPNKKFVSEHISLAEYRCSCCQKIPPDFKKGNEMSIEYILLFAYFEEIRLEYGKAIPISSGYRCPAHQLELYRKKKSVTPYSVHLFGLALDMVIPPGDIERVVKIVKETTPDMRVGWRAYKNNPTPHVHCDVGYLIIPRWSLQLRKGGEW